MKIFNWLVIVFVLFVFAAILLLPRFILRVTSARQMIARYVSRCIRELYRSSAIRSCCLVWHLKIRKHFQKTRHLSPDRELLIGRFSDVAIDGHFSIAAWTKAVKATSGFGLWRPGKSWNIPNYFSVSSRSHLRYKYLRAQTIDFWVRLSGFTSSLMTSKPRVEITIELNWLSSTTWLVCVGFPGNHRIAFSRPVWVAIVPWQF